MSDDRQGKRDGLEDLDWDNALDEWEKNTFVPEMARDAETNRVVTPLPAVPAETAEAEAAKSLPAPPTLPRLEEDEAPSVARLLSTAPRTSNRPSMRGGLDQLFSRKSPSPPEPQTEPGVTTPTPLPSIDELPSIEEIVEGNVLGESTRLILNAESSSPILVEEFDSGSIEIPDAYTPSDVYASDLQGTGEHPRADLIRVDQGITHLPADDEMPTLARPSSIPAALRASAPPFSLRESRPAAASAPSSFDEERPAARWLSEAKKTALEGSISWLEDEAQALDDPTARGRALLALSELSAIVGDPTRADGFATEARGVAPHVPLAWRQARQLMPSDPDMIAETLSAEAARSPTSSARAHAMLLAADVLRLHDRGDAAIERWASACKLDPADVRAPIARAALALAQDDHSSSALHVADNSELALLDRAVATALRLRGVERPHATVDPMPINDGLRHVRNALAEGDVVRAAQSATEIGAVAELMKGALWLSSALGAVNIASRRGSARSLKSLASDGDTLARRQLAARGMELGDPELVTAGLADPSAFYPTERAVLGLLSQRNSDAPAVDPAALSELAGDPDAIALVDALAALLPEAGDTADTFARARMAAGVGNARALATLGRFLASNVSTNALDVALEAIADPLPASAIGVKIEVDVRAKRFADLSETLATLDVSEDDGRAYQRDLAVALVAERANAQELANRAWKSASERATTSSDALVRIAAESDPDSDLGKDLLRLAETMPDGVPAAILRLEAIARSEFEVDEQATILERVHRIVPQLGIGSFLAEHVARRKGDVDEVVRWIQERRGYVTEPLEVALDAVREALLIADHDAEAAAARLEEAHRARPDDIALRELYERVAPETFESSALSWENRAAADAGPGAARLWLEAAVEYDRAGDAPATLRTARKAAEAGDRGLSRPLTLRAQLEAGDPKAMTDLLVEVAGAPDDDVVRLEAFERLADLEAFGRKDRTAALRWHRSILEAMPRHKPSLRWLEQTFIGDGRDDELADVFEQIALALDGTGGGEATGHAQLAARLVARAAQSTGQEGVADGRTHDMARLAATQPDVSLWALRALNSHARLRKDDEALFETSVALLERTQRPKERATLLLRASESAMRLERIPAARALVEQASTEDSGDVVTWGLLAELRERDGDAKLAAEACESLARASCIPDHQLLAWHDAAKLWFDAAKDTDRAIAALEAAAEIDITYGDIFPRLSALYAEKKRDADLARLLELRLRSVDDEDERVTLEVELARALADLGEHARAKGSLQRALVKRPDHTTALSAMADVCMTAGDWAGAEHASVRLARLLSDPAEQRAIYEKLGELYSVHAPNLPRAEVAYKEVLKRSPGDLGVLAKLVAVYKRQNDVGRAAEVQQEIVTASTDQDARLAALIELASIHEVVGRDPRKSERALDAARKEFPTSVVALRAMAEFYARQRQMPAMQILLDRAAADARRAFAQGRFVPALFQVLHAAFELRGKHDAARVVAATLAAVEGEPSNLGGAEAHAIDPQLDELLAPELMSPALRAVLQRSGDVLDVVSAIDLRVLAAKPLPPGTSIGKTIGSVATVIGLGALQILVSPHLGRVAIPLSSNPPTLLVGEGLARDKNELARSFVVVRALKMLVMRASSMLRGQPDDVSTLVAGLFVALNPSFLPPNLDAKKVTEIARRIAPALPKNLDPTVGVLALEAAGTLGASWTKLGLAAHAWANRVALLAVGDPNAALDAIAWGHDEEAPPTDAEARAAWIARHDDARELMTFSVTDAYAEARARLALDR